MKLFRFTFILFLLTSCSLFAQRPAPGQKWCGVSGKSEWLTRYQKGAIPRAEKSLTTQYIPMRIVAVGDNAGNGYVDPVAMLRSFELLNADFASTNIQFYLADYDFLKLSSLYDHSTSSQGLQLAGVRAQANKLNTFVVKNPAGNCGYAPLGGNFLLMGQDCMVPGDRTWAHEMGHIFTLAHTFHGWESKESISSIDPLQPAPETLQYRGRTVQVEKVDGSNCADAADGFCDTPPDYLMERWGCNLAGVYRDSLTDPDSTRFAVPGWNIMSYALDDCVSNFSDEQNMAMITNLAARGDFSANNSGEGAVAADAADVNLLLPEHNVTLPNSDYVEIVWNKVPNAHYYILQVNGSSNFNGSVQFSLITTDTSLVLTEGLLPGRRYYWRVRPVNRYVTASDFGEQVFRFKNGDFATATIDASLNAAITVAPNPVTSGRQLRIGGRDLPQGGNLSYELIDPAGRVLLSQQNLAISANGFNAVVPTATLPAGVYFLRLRLNEKLVTKRVVVTP